MQHDEQSHTLREFLDRSLSGFRKLPPGDVDSAWKRVLERSREERENDPVDSDATVSSAKWRWPAFTAAAAALFVVALISVGIVRNVKPPDHKEVVRSGGSVVDVPEGALAAVVDGSLYRASEGNTDALQAGYRIEAGEVVRTNDGNVATLSLTDGSTIEMGPSSELSLARADDGAAIRLSRGRVIVNAAKQPAGHLYVQTRDVTVSVVGTVFLVNAEAEGSRVAVIEGEVRVQQGATMKNLRPGEQMATNPVMKSQPIAKEIAWSRHVEAHMELLKRSGAVAAAPAPQRLEFEVASVKRNTLNGPTDFSPRRSGDLVMMHNTQPYSVIFYAYHLTANYQMQGYVRLPEGWNWYDIDARAPAGATDDQIRLMFQTLLADRFKLKVRRDRKEMRVYELRIAKGKPKLQPSSEGPTKLTIEGKTFIQPPATCGISSWLEGLHLVCHAATMDKIVSSLSGQLRAPVVDRTGLTGIYDLNIRFVSDDRRPDADADTGTAPYLEQAVEEELGLKLETVKGALEVIVIDKLEKPSEN